MKEIIIRANGQQRTNVINIEDDITVEALTNLVVNILATYHVKHKRRYGFP